MPPNAYSRHRFCIGTSDDEGRRFLGERLFYGYRELNDNRQHTVVEGDTLFNLAGRYFDAMPRAAGFFWVIADFQPDPIHDPTLRLEPGTVLVIPSLRTLQEEILNEARRRAEETET